MKTALPLLLLGTLACLLGAVMIWRVSVPLGSLITGAGLGLTGAGWMFLRRRSRAVESDGKNAD